MAKPNKPILKDTMPQYLTANCEDIPKYAKISSNGRTATFVEMREATGFDTPEAASEAFDAACASMSERSGVARWCLKWSASPSKRRSMFPGASRPTLDDLCSVFETYYVRCSRGWLSRPQRKYSAGILGWEPSFGLAVPFTTEASALAELAKHGAVQDGAVVRASCVFTAVSRPEGGSSNGDQVGLAISAACEARDIAESLALSARERLEASKAVLAMGSEPVKAKIRL